MRVKEGRKGAARAPDFNDRRNAGIAWRGEDAASNQATRDHTTITYLDALTMVWLINQDI